MATLAADIREVAAGPFALVTRRSAKPDGVAAEAIRVGVGAAGGDQTLEGVRVPGPLPDFVGLRVTGGARLAADVVRAGFDAGDFVRADVPGVVHGQRRLPDLVAVSLREPGQFLVLWDVFVDEEDVEIQRREPVVPAGTETGLDHAERFGFVGGPQDDAAVLLREMLRGFLDLAAEDEVEFVEFVGERPHRGLVRVGEQDDGIRLFFDFREHAGDGGFHRLEGQAGAEGVAGRFAERAEESDPVGARLDEMVSGENALASGAVDEVRADHGHRRGVAQFGQLRQGKLCLAFTDVEGEVTHRSEKACCM